MKKTIIRSLAAAIVMLASIGASAQSKAKTEAKAKAEVKTENSWRMSNRLGSYRPGGRLSSGDWAEETGWRLGVKGGWTYNSLSVNTQYAYDLRYKGSHTFDAGVWAQCMFLPWIGVRADLEWVNKPFRLTRSYSSVQNIEYNQYDGYVSLPVTATIRVGAGRVHGYANLGGYVAYWATSSYDGNALTLSKPELLPQTFYTLPVEGSREFDDRRDNRFEAGLVGVLGLEVEFIPQWFLGVEARYYYALTSRVKDYMPNFYNPQYNNTFTLSLTVSRAL